MHFIFVNVNKIYFILIWSTQKIICTHKYLPGFKVILIIIVIYIYRCLWIYIYIYIFIYIIIVILWFQNCEMKQLKRFPGLPGTSCRECSCNFKWPYIERGECTIHEAFIWHFSCSILKSNIISSILFVQQQSASHFLV